MEIENNFDFYFKLPYIKFSLDEGPSLILDDDDN